MKSKSDPRHNARKLAFSSIFCWLFNEPDENECSVLAQELLEENNTDMEVTKDLIKGVQENVDTIDQIIQKSAPDWPIDKISKVDLVILRVAIYEIIFGKKTPVKVAIDEAVELAKEFGNDTSHKFVNGVLGTVVDNTKDLKL